MASPRSNAARVAWRACVTKSVLVTVRTPGPGHPVLDDMVVYGFEYLAQCGK
jgi:hypothetical protein